MMEEKLSDLLGVHRALTVQRAAWDPWWDKLRDFVLPRRLNKGERDLQPDVYATDRLSDTTAIEACQKLASGHMSYITPSHDVWFKWSAPDDEGGDEAEAWYNQCSEIALRELSLSNFYTEVHECFLDRVALGTGSLFTGSTSDGRLRFTNIPCGQFACAENADGRIDTYVREFTYTAHQARTMFGEKALGPRAREILERGNAYDSVLRFLHIVRPRTRRNRRREQAAHMPFESVYISLDDRLIVEEGGYMEFPYLVTRFLKWGDGPYGLAPGRMCFPAIMQAQFLNRILDTLGELAAFPRILELANQVGEIDLRAGGRTVITPEAAAQHLPREWGTQGRYDVGLDRLTQKQEAIKRAFYLPMLELWSGNHAAMTATEVMARENERVLMFSPSFTLFVSDLYPTMERIFSLLFRMGRFPSPPKAVLRRTPHGELMVREPRVVYQSRIALVLRRLQNDGMDRALQRLSMMLQTVPELADHVDWDQCFRLSARVDGAPESMLRPVKEVERLRRERAEQQQNAPTATQQANAEAQSAAPDPYESLNPLLQQLTATQQDA